MKFSYAKIPLALYAAFYFLNYVRLHYLPMCYVFDSAHLQDIGLQVLKQYPDSNSTVILEQVHQRLLVEYPGYINPMRDEDWVFNNHGNAMGTMIILHASISEYLIFYGTATGTEGHSGVHWSEDYFLILTGQETAALPHARTPEVYKPGDVHHLWSGHQKQYAMTSDAWALELAQGWIPSMLPFGFLDTLTSTIDFYSFGKTCVLTALNMGKNLLRAKI